MAISLDGVSEFHAERMLRCSLVFVLEVAGKAWSVIDDVLWNLEKVSALVVVEAIAYSSSSRAWTVQASDASWIGRDYPIFTV